jgi:hypothetical protein
MKCYTSNSSFFEVRKVNSNLYRIFYCWESEFGSNKKNQEKMISSTDNLKKANKLANQFRQIFNMGYSEGIDW